MWSVRCCPRRRLRLPSPSRRTSPAKLRLNGWSQRHIARADSNEPIPMKTRLTLLLGGLIALVAGQVTVAQSGGLQLPKTVEAGSAFMIQTSGSGKAVLYIVGPAQVLRRDVQLGETTWFAAGELHNAGHYVVVLVGGSSTENGAFDVTAAHQPTALSFIAKPSRLPVDLHDGISGVAYVFDTFQNLVLQPTPVSFQLSGVAGAPQMRTVMTHNGVA